MNIEKLKIRNSASFNPKLSKAYDKLQKVIDALQKKEISQDVWNIINTDIKLINGFSGTEKGLKKALKKTALKILGLVEKELQYVSKNHYRNQWMALGMAIFGVTLGTAFSAIIDNYAFIGIGLPIGMALGMAYGATLDKKAEQDGKQLELECES